MIDSSTTIIVWCILQVSLIALAGIVISQVIARRNPFAASSGLCMAAVVCAWLTLLAPLPVHRWFLVDTRPSSAGFQSNPVALPGEEILDDELPSTTPMFDWRELVSPLRSLVTQADHFEQRAGTAVHSAVWLLAAVMGIGLWRFMAGMAFVFRIRRRSIPITDSSLLNLLRELSARMECRVAPEIRESREFTDAAVAGWLRPIVILPAEWREWSDEERRTVLAHEVAHTVRRDALWRLIAASVLAMHFYNPLIHWLLRRLALCQELASDAVAARAVGPRSYLRSLSSLAIRRDDQLGSHIVPSVLPVFSGHLIRRINVLHSMKEESEPKPFRRRRVASALMFTAFLGLGLAAVATRGIAQPPSREQKPATGSTTIIGVSSTKAISGQPLNVELPSKMFHRAPIDPEVFGATNTRGLAVFRMHEFLMRPEIRGFVPIWNALLSENMKEEFKTASPPSVDLEAIEWIAVRPSVASFQSQGEDKKSRLMLGADGLVVRLNRPFDLKPWWEGLKLYFEEKKPQSEEQKKFWPEMTSHMVEGKDVFRIFPVAFSPHPVYVWNEDERTIRVGNVTPKEITAETTLAELAGDKPKARPAAESGEPSPDEVDPLPWAATWSRMGGGLGSAVFAKVDVGELLKDFEQRDDFQTESLQTMGRALREFSARTTKMAVSFDIAEQTGQFGLRMCWMHASRTEALLSTENIREILTLVKAELAKELSGPREKNAAGEVELRSLRLQDEMLQAATISVDEYDDQTAAVVISAAIPFPKLVEMVVLGMSGERESP